VPRPDPAIPQATLVPAEAAPRKRSSAVRQTAKSKQSQLQRLVLAQWIQQRLCAASPLAYGPFQVAGLCAPSSYAGGDYFDFLTLKDGSLGVVIGDASGHGVESAFLMAQIRLCLRTLAHSSADVAQIFQYANRLLLGELPPDTFATIGMARLDQATRSLTYVGAGQPPAFVLNAAGTIECVLKSCEAPLGLSADAQYAACEPQQLRPGDAALFLTRGILRAPAADGRPFGSQRLLHLVHTHRARPAAEILETVRQSVSAHQSPLADDLTAVLVLSS
jgi:sigma-B regulation protein RsbU (phosphoserine phosphatase)